MTNGRHAGNFATLDMCRKCLELGASRVFDKSNEIESLVKHSRTLGSAGGR